MQNIIADTFSQLIENLINEYKANVEAEFQHLWNAWNIDITQKEIHEVIGGIIARQISLSIHFMSTPNNWNNEIAPLILRSMADNYINLAWILKEPEGRTKKFIAYGLGQEKLNVEHRKSQTSQDGLDVENDPVVEESQNWINSQKLHYLTIVDIGSWSEMSVYKMAEEADCKDFYNYVYQPFSVAVHNMWNHIGKHNVVISDNPLHRHLFIPIIPSLKIYLSYAELAGRYAEKCLDKFHQHFKIPRVENIAHQILLIGLNKLPLV